MRRHLTREGPRRDRAARGSPPSERTYYQVLGVDSEAEAFLIEAAYRALMRRHHPDRGGETWQAQRINEAYSVLRNDNARARYDVALRSKTPPKPMTAGGPTTAAAPPRARPRTSLVSCAYFALGLLLLISAAFSAGRSVVRVAGAVTGGAGGLSLDGVGWTAALQPAARAEPRPYSSADWPDLRPPTPPIRSQGAK